MSRWAYHVPILGYHKIGAFKGDHVPTVSAEAFERQLRWLWRWQYKVVGLEAVVASQEQGGPMPRRTTVITFDDGYEETCTIAWPLLKRFGLTATVFVTPGEVGLPGFATWEQIRSVAQEGMTIGSHTMHHSYLPLVPAERLSEELVGSKAAIEQRIQRPINFLSYPIGGYTLEAQRVAQEAGYLGACTTNRAVTTAMDRFALRRIKMTDRDAHPLLLRAKLSGYYDLFRRLKRPS